MQDTFTVAKT